MKKLLTLLLVLFFIPSLVYADLPDISSLTNDELIELNRLIQFTLFDKQLSDGVRVPQGTYTIGDDIPSGTYRIEIIDGTGYYDVYSKEGGATIYSGLTGKPYNVTEIGKIKLEDGNILKIVNSSFVFYPYTGIFH